MADEYHHGIVGVTPIIAGTMQRRHYDRAVYETLDRISESDIVTALREPLDIRRLRADLGRVRQKIDFKPKGLWVACGREWIDFSISNNMPIEPNIYRVGLDMRHIMHLSRPEDVVWFNGHYGYRDPNDDDEFDLIDWSRVAADCDGILICPYQRRLRRLAWYHPWDVASGCIWGFDAITEISQIF